MFAPADAINNAAGFGFRGYDENGEARWDLISNLRIRQIEVSEPLSGPPCGAGGASADCGVGSKGSTEGFSVTLPVVSLRQRWLVVNRVPGTKCGALWAELWGCDPVAVTGGQRERSRSDRCASS